jgi:RNA polymerase sigma factor (sigma-70 family)
VFVQGSLSESILAGFDDQGAIAQRSHTRFLDAPPAGGIESAHSQTGLHRGERGAGGEGLPRDVQQFEALVRRHAKLVGAVVRRVCRRSHASLAPDAEQEVYLALWKRLGSGKEIEHPISYLYKMALTTALAVVRRHRREEPLDQLPATRAPVRGALEPAERRRLLAEILGTLPPEEARAYLAGFNHAEVARLYGWSESVARHRIYRTLERLREAASRTGGAGDGE